MHAIAANRIRPNPTVPSLLLIDAGILPRSTQRALRKKFCLRALGVLRGEISFSQGISSLFTSRGMRRGIIAAIEIGRDFAPQLALDGPRILAGIYAVKSVFLSHGIELADQLPLIGHEAVEQIVPPVHIQPALPVIHLSRFQDAGHKVFGAKLQIKYQIRLHRE